jgi:HEAT repeat protein
MGSAAKSATQPLIETLQNGTPEAQREAVMALGAIGPDAAAAVPKLVERFKRMKTLEGADLAYSLGRIGPKASQAVGALSDGLASHDPTLPLICAWALAQIDPTNDVVAQKSVPLLIRGLDRPELTIRLASADALRRLGRRAQSAVPALVRASKAEQQPLRDAATAALDAVGANRR